MWRQKAGQMYGPKQRAEKAVKHEGDGDISSIVGPWNNPWEPGNETWRTGDYKKNWNYTSHSTTKISQDTEKSLGDLRRLAVTYTPVKSHLLELVWKTNQKDTTNNNKQHKTMP